MPGISQSQHIDSGYLRGRQWLRVRGRFGGAVCWRPGFPTSSEGLQRRGQISTLEEAMS